MQPVRTKAVGGPFLGQADRLLEAYSPLSGTSVSKSGDRLLNMAGVNQ